MRKVVLLSIVSSLVALALPAQSGFASSPAVGLTYIDPGVGGFMSPNIEYVATLPIESPGVSARVVKVGDVNRLYVSSAKGLAVYNVTNPALPILLGRLDTHNWENEDVAVSKDGKTVLMSDFEGVAYLITISVVDLPGGAVALVPAGQTSPGGNHTIECVDDACNFAYGSEGKIYNLTDKTKPTKLATGWGAVTGTGSAGHHVTRDASGLMWTDTSPIYALDAADPAHPTIVARSNRAVMSAQKTAYQHNNIRPFADLYDPRDTEEEQLIETLRPGELLLGEGETNFAPKCGTGSGPFTTYNLRDFEKPETPDFEPIEIFRPINGDYDGGNGNPQVNAMGCSGHWFDIGPMSTPEKIITANAWYDHGTRLFTVDGATGNIEQLGYFQPVVGAAAAAYWVGNEYIYVVDYERGIDILHFDKDAAVPSKRDFRASWLAKLNSTSAATIAEQYFCALAQRGGARKDQARLTAHI